MKVNVLLFNDFETLDAFGPVEVFGCVNEYELHYISAAGGVVTSKQGVAILTKTIRETDPSGILLIPGGQGTRLLVTDAEFIETLATIAQQAKYCLTVCTGSALLAKTGLLNNKRATSNKRALQWVKSINHEVLWIERARWVVDHTFYTSSGVSAGMDMTLGFIADRFGAETAAEIADSIEYVWISDPENDPFSL